MDLRKIVWVKTEHDRLAQLVGGGLWNYASQSGIQYLADTAPDPWQYEADEARLQCRQSAVRQVICLAQLADSTARAVAMATETVTLHG